MTPPTVQRQFRTINGLRTAEVILGAGDPILMLHGWGADLTLMSPLGERLAAKGYQVYIPDLPGFGESQSPPAAWSVIDYTNFVTAYLDAHQLERVFLVGHSFGGRLGLILGADHTARLSKMALISAAGVPPRKPFAARARLGLYKAVRDGLYASGARTIADRLRAWYNNRYGSTDLKNAGVLRDTFVKVVSQDLRPFAARVGVSTLLLWGEADTDTPLDQARVLEKLIPDAGLVTFPNASHYSYLEHLADFSRIIDHFFRHD